MPVPQGSHRLAKYTIYLKMKVLSWKVIENKICFENKATRCPEKLCVARKPRINFQSPELEDKFLWVFLRISSKYVDQNNANFCQKLGLMMSSVKIETDFRCSPEKYFWKSCHSVKSTWKPLLGLDVFLSSVSSRICSKNHCRDKGHKTKYWGEILSVDLLQIKFGIWRVTFSNNVVTSTGSPITIAQLT